MPFDPTPSASPDHIRALATLTPLEAHPALSVGMIQRDDGVSLLLVNAGDLMWSVVPCDPGTPGFAVLTHTGALTAEVYTGMTMPGCADWLRSRLRPLFPAVTPA